MGTGAWLPDPTRAGRLRYWDGSRWTEHVSRSGEVEADPIAGMPPPAAAPPAVAEDPASAGPEASRPAPATGGVHPPTILGRAGFAVAALGGVMTAATAGSTAVNQGDFGYIEVAGGSWIGVIAAVLCVAAAAAPWPWARIAGVGVSSFFAILVAFALIGFRTSEDLLPGVDVTLDTAGRLMLVGSLLLFAGTAIALVGMRPLVRAPDHAAAPREGKAVAALVVGIAGLLLPFLCAPAIGLALFAMDDHRATDGRIGARGIAVAGFVLGVAGLAIWAVALTLGMLLAQP